ncbi:F-box/FBD/LRR-repeat protein At4g00160-like [Vicia villosa]|uniref:F-box/FBD/LRR-repeat protein At4g00160-like n=1 Tax=Vicia villosa TaxID=3911 RepID=UPI00273AB1FE|nr:F-box/FBD/LRR-repeat protein At4g00160-like [Vicia villosa]
MSLDSVVVTNSSTAMSRRRLRIRIVRKEDRLSALPDSLIDHILSFLPTKDAFATSILSKSWKHLWRSQLNINLDDRPFPDTLAFHQFFNSLITMRDNTLPILSFHLKCHCAFFRKHHFHDFVYAPIARGVQILIIDLCYPATLPSLVLTTKTLTVLKLKRILLNYVRYVDLPSLQVLHLEDVTFTFLHCLHKLLSGCPILRELETNDLTIKTRTMMSATATASLSNLVTANISGNNTIGLEWLHNVDHLHIQLNWTPPTIRGMFHNLTHLNLIFSFDREHFAVSKWRWLVQMLQNTPNLQTLIIHEVFKVDAYAVNYFPIKEWKDPEIVPECLLSHLTTCSFRNYTHIDCELRFAKYIMQNSRLLNTMTIQSDKLFDTNIKLQILIDLSSCPRISPTCKLLFI